MKYNISWDSKEWHEFNQAGPVSNEEWLKEYEKWHLCFYYFSDFLQYARASLKTMLPEKDVKKVLPILSLLGAGQVKMLRIDDLELTVMEEEE